MSNASPQSAERLGKQPIIPLTLSLSLPVMISLFVQALYNTVDSAFLARYSEHGMTVLSIAFPIQTLTTAVACCAGVGANVLVSYWLGAGDRKRAVSIASHALLIALGSWILFAGIIPLLLPYYISWYTRTPEVIEMATVYTNIVVWFSLGVFVENVCARILQATACVKLPMLYQMGGAVINIILDPFLIFGWAGFPEMGAAGAAIATVIGQWMAAAAALITVLARKHVLPVSFRSFRFRGEDFKRILATGMPTTMGTALVSAYVAGLQAVFASFREEAVAALGIYYKLQTFLLMPTYGLNQGIMPILSYNFGANNYKRMWQTLWYSMIISTVTVIIGTIITWCFTNQLLNIFSATPAQREVAIPALRLISTSFPMFGAVILLPTLFQATGYLKENYAITIVRQVVLLVPIAYLLSRFGLIYGWLTFPLSEAGALVLCIIFTVRLWRGPLHYDRTTGEGDRKDALPRPTSVNQ